MRKSILNASYPEDDVMEMIRKLCDISGYGIRSGINIGDSGRQAAAFIIERLHDR